MPTSLNVVSISTISVDKTNSSNFNASVYTYTYPEFEFWLYDKNTKTVNAAAASAILASSPTLHPYKRIGSGIYNISTFDWQTYWSKYKTRMTSNSYTTSLYRYADPTYTFTYNDVTFTNLGGFLARYLADTQRERLCIIHWLKVGYDSGLTTDVVVGGGDGDGGDGGYAIQLNMDAYLAKASIEEMDALPTVGFLPASTNQTWSNTSVVVMSKFQPRPYNPIVEYHYDYPVEMPAAMTINSPANIVIGSDVTITNTGSLTITNGIFGTSTGSVTLEAPSGAITFTTPVVKNGLPVNTGTSTVYNNNPTFTSGLSLIGSCTFTQPSVLFDGVSNILTTQGVMTGNYLSATSNFNLNGSTIMSMAVNSNTLSIPDELVFSAGGKLTCLANYINMSQNVSVTSPTLSLVNGSVNISTIAAPFNYETPVDTVMYKSATTPTVLSNQVEQTLTGGDILSKTVHLPSTGISGNINLTLNQGVLNSIMSGYDTYSILNFGIVNNNTTWQVSVISGDTVNVVIHTPIRAAPMDITNIKVVKIGSTKYLVTMDSMHTPISGINGVNLSTIVPMNTNSLTVTGSMVVGSNVNATVPALAIPSMNITSNLNVTMDMNVKGLQNVTTLSALNNTYNVNGLLLKTHPINDIGVNLSAVYTTQTATLDIDHLDSYKMLVNTNSEYATWTLPTYSLLATAIGNGSREFMIHNTQAGNFIELISGHSNVVICGSRRVYAKTAVPCNLWYDTIRRTYNLNMLV